jgi:predicted Zn-dependent protease with MMP-like domain
MTTTQDRFEELAEEAVESLPDWVHESLDNVEIFIDDFPPRGQPNLLGLYQGIPLSKRGSGYSGAMPDSITLYRSTIERVAGGDAARLRAVIAHTVAHEIAHHFGISDERLKEIDAY